MEKSSRELLKEMRYDSLDNFDLTSDGCIKSYLHEVKNDKKKSLIESLGLVNPPSEGKNSYLPEEYHNNVDTLFSTTSNPLRIEYDASGRPARLMWENSYLDDTNDWTMSTGSLSNQFAYKNHFERNEEYYYGRVCERCGKVMNFFERNEGYGVCHKCEVEMGWRKELGTPSGIREFISNIDNDEMNQLIYYGKITPFNELKDLRGYLVEI